MAKKRSAGNKSLGKQAASAKAKKSFQMSDELPKNIYLVGERSEENKKIYISQQVYKEIHRFTANKTKNESGGVLVGKVIEELGYTNIMIYGFIEGKHSEGTPTTLKFTHETWDYINKVKDSKYEEAQILGWIHTHPDFGIFLSEYDTFIQENYFNGENQIAYVVDPIQGIEGFYFWIDEKITKCNSFYIFDEVGQTIDIEDQQEPVEVEYTRERGVSTSNLVLVGLLILTIIVFGIITIKQSAEIKVLEMQLQQYQYDTEQDANAEDGQTIVLDENGNPITQDGQDGDVKLPEANGETDNE